MYVRLSISTVVRRPFSIFVSVLISNVGVQRRNAFIIAYNSQLEDTLEEFKLFTLPRVWNQNLFTRNKKIVVLHTTAPFIGCTVKETLFFLTILHKSIKYWACELRL